MRTARFAPVATLLAAALGLVAPASAADDYPPLRPGRWRFHRTVEDPATPGSKKVLDSEKCADPVADMRAMNDQLVKIGCRFSPATREGDVYRFTATCPLPDAGEAVSVSVLTYLSAEAYDLAVEARGIPGSPSGATHEELEARRIGDCP